MEKQSNRKGKRPKKNGYSKEPEMQLEEYLKLKTEMAKNGWEIEEHTGTAGWGGKIGYIGYAVWAERWDWHGKSSASLTGNKISLFALCDDAADKEKVLQAMRRLSDLTKRAWKEFPDSIPELNAKGELSEAHMVRPFADGKPRRDKGAGQPS